MLITAAVHPVNLDVEGRLTQQGHVADLFCYRGLQFNTTLLHMQTASIQAVKPNPTILDYACTKVSSAWSCLKMTVS